MSVLLRISVFHPTLPHAFLHLLRATDSKFVPQTRILSDARQHPLNPLKRIRHDTGDAMVVKCKASEVRWFEENRTVRAVTCAHQQRTMPPGDNCAYMYTPPSLTVGEHSYPTVQQKVL
eukprot:1242682-Prymnesium_polylepis.2